MSPLFSLKRDAPRGRATATSSGAEPRMSPFFLPLRNLECPRSFSFKLYSDPPLVRLAILGEHVWLQCYHTDFEVGTRPLYVFQHDRQEHGLYALWYQYFLKRWTDQTLPEYDLDRDELVYREESDGELKREVLDPGLATIASQLDPAVVSMTSQAVDIASV